MIQKDPRLAKLELRSQAVSTLMAIILVVLLIQLWLLTIALEDFLAARTRLAIPTFAASGFCFLLNLWLLRYLYVLDRDREK
jgi:uncharacterized membrane protein (DUF485 family)